MSLFLSFLIGFLGMAVFVAGILALFFLTEYATINAAGIIAGVLAVLAVVALWIGTVP